MGTCCGNSRPNHNKSIYCIEPDGKCIVEYNINSEQFCAYPLKQQIPAMAKYCEILPGRIFIAGGFKRLKNKSGEPVADVFMFEKESGLTPKPSLDTPRTGHCMISVLGSAFLISGVVSHVRPTTECSKFSFYSNSWQKIANISRPRILAAGCNIGSFIYVTGGNPGNSLQNYRDIEKYSVLQDRWEDVELKLPLDIWRHACLPHKNGVIIFGGNGNRNHNLDCFRIDLENSIVLQQTWMAQGGEFQGCNSGEGDRVYAFETTNCKMVWAFAQGKWTSKAKSVKTVFEEENTL
jgi:hypothetical protein